MVDSRLELCKSHTVPQTRPVDCQGERERGSAARHRRRNSTRCPGIDTHYLEGQANGPNPTVVVRVELRCRDLYSSADPKMESLRNVKITKDHTWREEGLGLSCVGSIPKEG